MVKDMVRTSAFSLLILHAISHHFIKPHNTSPISHDKTRIEKYDIDKLFRVRSYFLCKYKIKDSELLTNILERSLKS